MVETITYNLANFRHIRNSLSLDAAKIFMHALILSHVAYCITCWGQAGETAVRPLESLHKKTVDKTQYISITGEIKFTEL